MIHVNTDQFVLLVLFKFSFRVNSRVLLTIVQ